MIDPVWFKYLQLLGQGIERLPDGRWLGYSSVKEYYNL